MTLARTKADKKSEHEHKSGGASATPGKKTQSAHAAASAPAGLNMAKLEAFIGKHEGKVDHVYLDSRGFKTAGIGHLLAGTSYSVGEHVSEQQIAEWFQHDVATAIAGAKQDMGATFDKLDEDRKMVIIDMVFNLGAGPSGFGGFHATIAAIQRGDYAQAADNMLHSLWASQVGHRATEDAALMRHGGGAAGGTGKAEGGGGKTGGGASHHGGGGASHHGGGAHHGGGGPHHGNDPNPGPNTAALGEVRDGHAVLKVGDRGPAVAEVQRLLHIPDDGIFGRQTLEAVQKFQIQHHLAVDGIVGIHTLGALEHEAPAPANKKKPEHPHPSSGGAAAGGKGSAKGGGGHDAGPAHGKSKWAAAPSIDAVKKGTATIKEGERGPAVKEVQNLLAITADGEFGAMTKAAVVEFQRAHKESLHDGVVNAHTLELMIKHPAGSVKGESGNGSSQRARMLSIARGGSEGRRPDGRCYYHVCQFLIECHGYGKITNPYTQFPSGDLPVAHDFADLMNSKEGQRFGLERLGLHNPYDAPPGAIIVVKAGSPGTANPTAGDISIADGHGNFFNGGMMSYGGREGWNSAPRAVLLGCYIPK